MDIARLLSRLARNGKASDILERIVDARLDTAHATTVVYRETSKITMEGPAFERICRVDDAAWARANRAESLLSFARETNIRPA